MLHYGTWPARSRWLAEHGIRAISMDGIVDDDGRRRVEAFAAVGWNGVRAAFGEIAKLHPTFSHPEPASVARDVPRRRGGGRPRRPRGHAVRRPEAARGAGLPAGPGRGGRPCSTSISRGTRTTCARGSRAHRPADRRHAAARSLAAGRAERVDRRAPGGRRDPRPVCRHVRPERATRRRPRASKASRRATSTSGCSRPTTRRTTACLRHRSDGEPARDALLLRVAGTNAAGMHGAVRLAARAVSFP